MNLQNTLFCLVYISFVELLSIPFSCSLKSNASHQLSTCNCTFPTGSGMNLEPIKDILSSINVDLVCEEDAVTPKMVVKPNVGLNQYTLELRSKHACVHTLTAEEGPDKGLSTGSVLVIMLLVLTLVYFGGGMLTLRLLRGAEGKEMIPNVDFWMDLPYLVRDGILFTLNGFTPAASYERI